MVSPTDTSSATSPSPPLLASIDAVLALQQERALAYQRMNDGFKLYMTNLEEATYQSLLVETTKEFSALSTRARELEADLRGPLNRTDAADIVRTIQESEQAKLYDTIALQAMRGSIAAKRFSWQHVAEIGDEVAVCGSCAGGGCGHGDAAEPTESDVKNVTQEAYQHLETCVTAINESIQELRQLREELLP